jgi:hypothetical protein
LRQSKYSLYWYINKYNNENNLRLDKIYKNIKLYNTYFDKNQDAEYEKLKKNQEDVDNIRAGLQAGVGCSVRIAGIRRMKQTYYE